MKNNDCVRNENEIVTLHEVGHIIGLYASGIIDEFISATNVASDGPSGKTYGLTRRSGQSLMELCNKLSEAVSQGAFGRMAEESAEICLPQICYFCGGGSIDRMYGNASERRESIDMAELKTKLLPAMFVNNVSEEALKELKDMVDEFLHSSFRKYDVLVDALYDKLAEANMIDKTIFNEVLDGVKDDCSLEAVAVDYETLKKKFRNWTDKYQQKF